MKKLKLKLNKETLKALTPKDASRVQGGLPRQGWSDLVGCSTGGGPCTSGCTGGSVRCSGGGFC
ncbi:MAG TPA: hypothetical protein VHL14_11485 [Steroidobacteraceae bacterium]|nr:hypothetical protein [Steroidobacteraceae bacterium]